MYIINDVQDSYDLGRPIVAYNIFGPRHVSLNRIFNDRHKELNRDMIA